MTNGTVESNCNRLKAFLEDSYHITYSGESSPKYLCEVYGRILDYHGAPRRGLGRLFLNPDDYVEMEEWVASCHMAIIYHREALNGPVEVSGGQTIHAIAPAMMGFMYNGYEWNIERKEIVQP